MFDKRRLALAGFAVLMIGFTPGCKKRLAPAAPPPAPPPEITSVPKPDPPTIVEFVTEPNSIQQGEYALLRWLVTNADEVTIQPNLGSVAAKARQRISPKESTRYVLTARGPGGKATASTTITVTAPPAPPTPPRTASLVERIASDVQDIYFDFDESDLRPDAIAKLTRNASALKTILLDFPTASFILQGHCDERGSAEYNIGLGDRRATAAKDFLSGLGIPAQRLLVVSYGKEHPQCTEPNEECWQRNRRVHFVPGEDATDN